MNGILMELFSKEVDDSATRLLAKVQKMDDNQIINMLEHFARMEIMAHAMKDGEMSIVKSMAFHYMVPIIRAKLRKDIPMPKAVSTQAIEPHWEGFARAAVPPQAGAKQKHDMRMAFYGGVAIGLRMALNFMAYQEGGEEKMLEVLAQLNSFLDELKAKQDTKKF